MTVELVGREGWDAVLADWTALYAKDPTATPFLSPGWARAWMREWAPGAEPWLLRVSDGGRAVGLAPLVLERRRGVRVLDMLGNGTGDYWDVLAEPHRRGAVVAEVAEELVRRRRAWDLAFVTGLPAGSPTPAALAEAGLAVHRRPPIACPSLPLPATFDEYLAGMSRSRRGDLRRHLRRLDDGTVQLRAVTDPAELPGVVSRWQDLRRRQWEAQHKTISPVHLSERFRDFMVALLGELIPSGQALLWEFHHEGRPVGVFVNFADDRAYYCYLGGTEPAALSLGIGKTAIGEGIRSSIAAGRQVYDFMRGAEPYKYWYGSTDTHVAALVLGNRGIRSRAALMAMGARFRWRDRPRAAAASDG